MHPRSGTNPAKDELNAPVKLNSITPTVAGPANNKNYYHKVAAVLVCSHITGSRIVMIISNC